MNYKNLLCKLLYIYLCVSFNEWFIHKYIMHGDEKQLSKIPLAGQRLARISKEHRKHHNLISMNMKPNPHNHTNSFCWPTIFMFSFIVYIQLIPLFKNTNINLCVSFTVSLLYAFLWNNIHNDMHNSTGYTYIKNGPPNILKHKLTNNPLYSYLWYNHAIHHLQKGQKFNFNIICVGFDHIMGTLHDRCYDNVKYCEQNPTDQRCLTSTNRYCLRANDVHR